MGNTPPGIPDEPEGPTSGIVGVSYTYITITGDPEGDDIEYLFDWGDGSQSDWVSAPFASHKWLEIGEYGIKVKARDQWDESEWSSYEMINMDEGSLDVAIEADPTTAIVGEEIQCSATISGGTEPYTYDWDFGDGNTSSEQNPTHVYQSMDNFTISLSVLDNIGAYGSNYTQVNIELTHPPDTPTITGVTTCLVGEPCSYTVSATDPDDDIYIMIDWGDGTTSDWIGPKASGDEFVIEHVWNFDGNYAVKAKTKDAFDYESSTWSESVEVTVEWQQAFLLGKIKDKEEKQDTIEFTAESLFYVSTDPSFVINKYSSEEQIIILNDGSGFIRDTFIIGNFKLGYIPN